ncbi:hypothetical protein FA13DRAFT_381293 [Coprinellus micaceus]|uniref:Uncharacterized protein n=1 Tax=Coprinellus micaceus TaxID=71717 RepID=A0A4Y7SEA6_COPMI|nr:hypothetical protein FA13DRAFT_381293 [Coprinellus micaceus]
MRGSRKYAENRRKSQDIDIPLSSKQNISKLRTRDPAEIWPLYGTIKVEDFTLDFTRALLDNLKNDFYPEQPEGPPDQVNGGIRRCALAAMASVSLLTKVTTIEETQPRLLVGTATLIVESLGLIVQWADMALAIEAPLSDLPAPGDISRCCLEIAGLFYALRAMHRSIHDAMMSSTGFIRLLIDIWTKPANQNGHDEYCLLWHLPARCPAVRLLREVAASPEGKRLFLEGLVFHDLEETFAAATIRRVAQVEEEVAKADCAEGYEIYMADYFIPIIQDLGLSSDNRVAPYFRKLKYITRLTKASNQISVSLVKDGKMPRQKAAKVAVILARLIQIALLEDPYMMRSFGYLVEGAYLEMLARTIVRGYAGDPADDDVAHALQALDFIALWTVYPAMGKRLVRSRFALHPGHGYHGVSASDWRDLEGVLAGRLG